MATTTTTVPLSTHISSCLFPTTLLHLFLFSSCSDMFLHEPAYMNLSLLTKLHFLRLIDGKSVAEMATSDAG
jgi:hypothetical protein